MQRQVRTTPRKRPRQARSRATVDSVLAATARVLVKRGFDGLTTNLVAETAGVSIGSLYQYFPNKDSILAALVREHIAEGTRELVAALDGPTDLESLVRRAVSALAELHASDRRLHRVLFEESPRPASLREELQRLEDALVAGVAARLATALPALSDPGLVARIVVTTIESLVHRLVASDRELDVARFVDETTRLVSRYLEDARAPGRRRGAPTTGTARRISFSIPFK